MRAKDVHAAFVRGEEWANADRSRVRDDLVLLLRAYVTSSEMNEEETHRVAERFLLNIVGDAELTTLWRKAAKRWWYA